jgi:hypothetical protein
MLINQCISVCCKIILLIRWGKMRGDENIRYRKDVSNGDFGGTSRLAGGSQLQQYTSKLPKSA